MYTGILLKVAHAANNSLSFFLPKFQHTETCTTPVALLDVVSQLKPETLQTHCLATSSELLAGAARRSRAASPSSTSISPLACNTGSALLPNWPGTGLHQWHTVGVAVAAPSSRCCFLLPSPITALLHSTASLNSPSILMDCHTKDG